MAPKRITTRPSALARLATVLSTLVHKSKSAFPVMALGKFRSTEPRIPYDCPLLQIFSSAAVTLKLIFPMTGIAWSVRDKLLTYSTQGLARLVLRPPYRLRTCPHHRRSRSYPAHRHRGRKFRQPDPSHGPPPHRLRRSLHRLAPIHRRRRSRIPLRRASRFRSLGALSDRDGNRLQLVRDSAPSC
jgi:hypothetical protein